MSSLSKQQLGVENQTSFPNNTTGYISPTLLRTFNTNIIDSTVNQTGYNTDSSSVSAQLVGLNSYTQSLNTNFITSGSLNAATASLSASLTTTINQKLNSSSFIAYTASTNARLDYLEVKVAYVSESNNFEMDNTFEQQVYIGEDLNVIGKGSFTGSIVVAGNITGSLLRITDNTVLGRNIDNITRVSGSLITDILIIDGENFQDFSQSVVNGLNSGSSFPAFSASVDSRLDSLEAFSSSLADTYATDIELAAVSVSLNLGKLSTSSFNSYSASAYSQSLFVSNSFSSSLSSVSQSINNTITTLSSSIYLTDATQSNNITLLSQSLYFTDTTQSVNITQASASAWGSFQSASAYSASAASASTALSASISSSYVSKNASNQTLSGALTITGSIAITGSSNSNVVVITPASNTASIDMSKGNFFTLTIPSSSITLIRATNIKEGQTVGIKLSQLATTGSVRFDTPFKFWSGSAQYNTGSAISGGVDLFTFMTFDTSSLYTSAIKNLV
jgi:hypothetical protein